MLPMLKYLEFFKLSRRTWIWVAALHVAAVALGVVTGFALMRELPGIDRMDLMTLSKVSVLEDRYGKPLHSFAEQKRIPVPLSEVSHWFVEAIVATEDPRFLKHFGVDVVAVARAALRNLSSNRRAEGASTITMQLARDEFLHHRKTFKRKVLEAVYASQIELHYSKEDILTQYCNRIYLGHGRYGVEAASRFFFDKPASQLDLPEAALLAGLANLPEKLTPLRYPVRALHRRNHVLDRMVVEGVLVAEEAERAKKIPITLAKKTPTRKLAPHFIEQVRRFMVAEYGEEAVYREGLTARTTLDPKLQIAAERAVRWGLDQYGRRWKQLPVPQPLPEGSDPASYQDPAWFHEQQVDDILPALVESIDKKQATIRIGGTRVTMDARSIAWTGKKTLNSLLEVNALIPIKVVKLGQEGQVIRVDLAAEPSAEAALVAIDAATGEVLAHVGGRDFEKTQWDLAMQAGRQPGSAFKPFIFAAALEQGFRSTDRLYDVPTVLVDAGSPKPYQPENYELDYEGFVTLRHALEHSRNIPTVRLLDALGYQPAVDMARRLGISSDLQPFPSLALGSFDVKLVDLVAAYAAFVNGGVLVKPRLLREVRHSDGRLLLAAAPEAREVLTPEVSAMMVSLLEGIVLHGTGRGALALGRPVGGKTGTTDDFNNALFVGFTPSIAVGVWVGHQDNRTLGKRESGARAALPIWTHFLDEGLEGEPVQDFVRPPGVTRTLVDATTGLRARRGAPCGKVILETFARHEEPLRACDRRENRRITLPYPLQSYPIDAEGRLMLPPADAARMITNAPARLRVTNRGQTLNWNWGKRVGSIPLAWSLEDRALFFETLPSANETLLQRRLAEEDFREDFEKDLSEREKRGETWPGDERPEADDYLPAEFRTGRDGWPAFLLKTNRSGRVRRPALPEDPPE